MLLFNTLLLVTYIDLDNSNPMQHLPSTCVTLSPLSGTHWATEVAIVPGPSVYDTTHLSLLPDPASPRRLLPKKVPLLCSQHEPTAFTHQIANQSVTRTQ